MKLLQIAKLLDYFTVLWSLSDREDIPLGAYKDDGEWLWFDPPQDLIHKADVLRDTILRPEMWFPQLDFSSGASMRSQLPTYLEEIVLVDDQRTNFQSYSGIKVLRYCKVPRYDGIDPRPEAAGQFRIMGGVGAHSDADYDHICAFVKEPWQFQSQLQLICVERAFAQASKRLPIRLVVFGFDETLTLATFMPQDRECRQQIGWRPAASAADVNTNNAGENSIRGAGEDADEKEVWSVQDLVDFNFESPYVLGGERVPKLRRMLEELTQDSDQDRRLAILSRNTDGAIAILNLLRMANLEEYFSAIWALRSDGMKDDCPNGVHRSEEGKWQTYCPPFCNAGNHKADVLYAIASDPGSWLPDLKGKVAAWAPEEVALIDDQRDNFRSDLHPFREVFRYCKVARYDDEYRDCGFLNMLGGIGARDNADFEDLKSFVREPWRFHVPALIPREHSLREGTSLVHCVQTVDSKETPKMTRKRSQKALLPPL
eukprot:CAMPEP_0178373994 /NCGR_PEP_ID=MMETSP0689_2-20121128/2149_1 /TAXON_ID=160604 /ORGANISM="Amphidinium massartii, Strain CS-259" /LENGTH=485 /DNA_ID=CAMNT_0019993953 /DNA_START=144 /DNA_END=1604 /DNA_ORIENTATION=-